MTIKLEKTIILLIIAAFITTSVSSLSSIPEPSTKEGAIEISKEAKLVKEGLANAYISSTETNYYNYSMIERIKRLHSDPIFKNVPKGAFWEEKVLEGHSVWEVTWWFRNEREIWGHSAIVIVDSETGAIIQEEMGIRLLLRDQ